MEVLSGFEIEGNRNPAHILKDSGHDLGKCLINHHLGTPKLNFH